MTTTKARHSSESNEHYTPAEIVEAARNLMGGIDLDPASSAIAQETVKAEHWFGIEDNGLSKQWLGRSDRSRVFLNPPGGRCDDAGRLVITKSGDRPACTETGMCGLPPGHEHRGVQSSQRAWWRKLCREYGSGRGRQAVFVAFSVELLQTAQVGVSPVNRRAFPSDNFQGFPTDFPICFPRHRIAYCKPDGSVGKSPPHSSCIVYLPPWDLPKAEAMNDFKDAFGWLGAIK